MKRLAIALTVIAVCAAAAYAATTLPARTTASSMAALDQGWTPQIAHQMWHKAQGAVFMPAAFFAALRDKNGVRFEAPATLAKFGFIADAPSRENPRGWPIGFAIDDGTRNHGIPQFGFTCTACHTTHLDYNGKHVLIEGAGGTITATPFIGAINAALVETYRDPARRAAFIKDAESEGYPKGRAEPDMSALAAKLQANAAAAASVNGASTPGGPGRVDALSGIVYNLMVKALGVPGNARLAVAPVNYPPVWDIWHLDWVQYNASVHQPMNRNVGEAVGLGAQLNIIDAAGNLNPPATRWKSSVRIKNLHWIETQLEHLKAPVWPAVVFGAVDEAKARTGRVLFAQNCARCHGISKIAGGYEWAVHTIPLDRIGTDPNQATAFAKTTYDARKVGMSEHQNGPAALNAVVEHLKIQGYIDEGIPKSKWPAYDGFGRKTVTVAPCGYKARPLIGIWATAPFLHNGTVPSVYDMLSETRPEHPIIGNPEFDPIKLGMVQQSTPLTLTLNLSLLGNSNAGHWWTNDKTRKGRIGPALTEAQKYAIIEYLKIANYDNYPTKTVAAGYPLPCGDNLHWADNASLNVMPAR